MFALLLLLVVSFGITGGCSNNGNNDGDNPQPTPMPTSTPTPTPAPTPMPTPGPTPAPGGSIIEPGGTLSMVPETFDYVGDGNNRQMLDYYEISGLPSQTVATISTRADDGSRPALVFLHGGAWLFGDRGDVDPLIFEAAEIAGFHVISVGYRLATEAAWPAQIHDANAAQYAG